jgi:Flp pilus assembly protein TadB
MIWNLIEPFIGYIAAAVAALGVFLAAQAKARRDGRKRERQKQEDLDRENADAIRRRVDDARRRLRHDDRFRD